MRGKAGGEGMSSGSGVDSLLWVMPAFSSSVSVLPSSEGVVTVVPGELTRVSKIEKSLKGVAGVLVPLLLIRSAMDSRGFSCR